MPKAEYIRKINQSSLMIIPEKEYETEKDSIEMFRYHLIPDFLKMKVQKKNTNAQFCYDITSKRSLQQLLEYKLLDYLLLLKILSSFDDACMQTEEFMMTENDILLEPEFVFADHNLEQMSYCYVPGHQTDICQQFKAFMGYLLQHLDHKDEQAVQLAYFVYQRVVEEQTALHYVLQDDRYRQFEHEAAARQFEHEAAARQSEQMVVAKQFEQDMDLRQLKQNADIEKTVYGMQAKRSYQQPEESHRENGCQCLKESYIENGYQCSKESYTENGCQCSKESCTENRCQQPEEDYNKRTCTNSLKIMEELDRQSIYYMKEQEPITDIFMKQDQTSEHLCKHQAPENPWLKQEALPKEDDFQIKYQPDKKQKKEKFVSRKQAERQEQAERQKQTERQKQAEWKRQNQPAVPVQESDVESKIEKKETIRKQAAEKLKNMLRRKIYTDRTRFPQEDTVFEADAEEEPLPHSNPTVCLMPEGAGIQNRFVYQGPDRSRDFHCMKGKMILGSDASESDIYIPVPMVSRVHARIEADTQRTVLEDLNSTNGTHVNGELLQFHERRILQKGDIISLAGECYSFH